MAKITSLLIALVAIAQLSVAAPAAAPSSSSVASSFGGRKRVSPAIANKNFVSVPTFTTSSSSLTGPSSSGKPEDIAAAFVASQLGIPASEYRVSTVVPLSNGATAVHLRQVVNGLDVANGDMNINIGKNGAVMSFGNSFFKGARPSAPPATVQPGQAHTATSSGTKVSPQAGFEKLAAAVGLSLDGKKVEVIPTSVAATAAGKPARKSWNIKTDAALSDVPVKFAYVQSGDSLSLTYSYTVELDNAWYNAHVDTNTGEVQHLADWVSDALYAAVPAGRLNPDDGGIQTIKAEVGGFIDKAASPLGWHAQSAAKSFTDTRGNNVFAQENLSGGNGFLNNQRPDGGAALDFTKFKPDLTKDPSTYTLGSTAQLFVVVNQMHDIAFHYGFDEKSGNFQENNFGKGGKQGDAVVANAQDGSGTNNANFASPPDGQRGKMRMFVFTVTNPNRDGTLDTGVPIHEFGHGISNRLTGGPANANCLNTIEAGGMGEGWSDMLALAVDAKAADTRDTPQPLGVFVINKAKGIRTFPYSTNLKVNPLKYSNLAQQAFQEVHKAGEVWTSALFEVYWNLRDKLGKVADLRQGAASGKGDALFLQIMLDGMKLQPCNPTFLQARDAFIQAEKNLTGGKFACDVIKGFAKRGMGIGAGNAQNGFTDSNAVTPECVGK
ncbi:Fungalysin metallopeptidase-domain-containing protein [Blastocladiella britannica]|nr:Fungalysin metallopeptidase-domain-containing protein [Blastocladiella britannica]